MKKIYAPVMLAAGLLFSAGNAQSQVPTYAWAKDFYSSPAGNYIYQPTGNAIITDASANVYTTGWFRGTADFDPGPGVASGTSAGNGLYILKLDAQGNFGWVDIVTSGVSNAHVSGNSLTNDAAGNIYVTGSFNGTIDFDPGAGVFNLTGGGVFVLKLDAQGNFAWAKSIAGSIQSPRIKADAAGNTHLAGSYVLTIDADPGAGTHNLTSAGNTDFFVIKLDPAGNFTWGVTIGGSQTEFYTSLEVDNYGNVITTGYYNATADFDPGPGVANLSPLGSNDVFILSLNASGNFIWVKSIGGTDMDIGVCVETDATGNVYVSGSFQGTVDFDPGAGTYNLSSVSQLFSDLFIVKLNAEGYFVWAIALSVPGCSNNYMLAMDPSDELYVCGNFKDSHDFDPGPGSYLMAPSAPVITDMFIVKLNHLNGGFMWARQVGGDQHVAADVITIANDYSIYTAGFFSGTADFDPDAGADLISAMTPQSMFVHKLNQNATTGTGEATATGGVSVYPNPGNGVFRIVTEEVADQFVVTDVFGKEILRRKPVSENEWIDLSNEAAGVYFLLVLNGNEQNVLRLAVEK